MVVEQQINLEKYECPEKRNIMPVKFDYPIPRTREAGEEKHFVYFDSKSQIEASVLTRKVEDFCLPSLIGFASEILSPADTYLKAWKILKDRGFYVVPSVRKVDMNVVATTNLSADNMTSVYDQKIDIAEVRETFPMDGVFSKIPVREINNEAVKIVNLANRVGVELMVDGPFHVVVQGDGKWLLILLDIGKVRIYEKPKDLPESTKKDNIFYVRKAVTAFAKIQQNIKCLREARGLT